LALAPAARAHDFWIRPRTWTPEPNAVLSLELEVGDRFAGEALPREEAFLRRFEFLHDGARGNVVGFEGRAPAGLLRPKEGGVYVVGFESLPRYLEIGPEKFGAYLVEEGLDGILALREARGETGRPGKERFVRCAKTLLRVAGPAEPPPAAGWDAQVGLALELVPHSDPFSAEPLCLELRFRGAPLAGALVTAAARDGDAGEGATPGLVLLEGRTDEQGRVTFPIGVGTWLVAATHMTPAAPDGSGAAARAEWESHWASLTFQRRPSGAGRGS